MGKGVPKISILNGTETNGPRGKKNFTAVLHFK